VYHRIARGGHGGTSDYAECSGRAEIDWDYCLSSGGREHQEREGRSAHDNSPRKLKSQQSPKIAGHAFPRPTQTECRKIHLVPVNTSSLLNILHVKRIFPLL
jgi:hypothetical protein